MSVPRHAALLRIYTSEQHHCDGRPLYETIVLTARERHLAGATVLRGPLGYGQSGRIHTAKILDLSADLPMVIEIVDQRERIDAFVAEIRPLLAALVVTIETVEILSPDP